MIKDMAEQLAISVIIPVYKIPEKYLRQCICTVKNQTFSDVEIIFIDDNDDNDNCGILCDEFQKKYQNVITLHQRNQGVSVARNNGLNHAKGKWISFVDPDDWLEPNYLERLYKEGEKSDADIVMCSCFANYKNREKTNKFFNYKDKLFIDEEKDEIQLQLICRGINDYFPPESGIGVPWAKLYRRQFLRMKNLTFDPNLIRMQDNIFNLYAVEKANKVYYFNEFLYHYRKYNQSAISKFTPKIIDYIERVNKATETFIKEYNKGELYYKALYAKILMGFNNYFNLFYLPAYHKKQEKFKSIKKEIVKLLSKPMYKNACKNLDSNILRCKERIFVNLLKNKKIGFVLVLTILMNKFKSIKNGLI
jgi:Glycosyltransferases, probably involved in cell wall biogenesis